MDGIEFQEMIFAPACGTCGAFGLFGHRALNWIKLLLDNKYIPQGLITTYLRYADVMIFPILLIFSLIFAIIFVNYLLFYILLSYFFIISKTIKERRDFVLFMVGIGSLWRMTFFQLMYSYFLIFGHN